MYEKLQKRKKNHSNISTKVKQDHELAYQPTISQQLSKYSIQHQQIQYIPETFGSKLPEDFLKLQQNSSITQVFQYIQNPIKYQQMEIEGILEQKYTLQDHIYFLNAQLNQLVKKRLNRIEAGASRKTNKNHKNQSKIINNDWDQSSIQRQILANNKLLILLDDQYDFLKKRLNRTQQSNYKVQCESKIKHTKQQITKTKLFLSERKRKNVLNSKRITQLDKADKHKQYYEIQQQYVTLSKKKQEYNKKIDKIIEDNAKIIEEQSKAQDKTLQLKKEAFEVLKSLPNQMQEQHNRVIYDAKCRKMELCLRKRQREQEMFKKKYYELLKDYQKILQNNKILDEKIMKVRNQIYTSMDKSKSNQSKIQEIQNKKKQEKNQQYRIWRVDDQSNQSKQPSQNGFMLTQLNKQKSTTKIVKNSVSPNHFMSQKRQKRPKIHSDYSFIHAMKLAPIRVSTQPNQSQGRGRKTHAKNHYNSQIYQLYQHNENNDIYRVESRQTEKKQSQQNKILLRNESVGVQNSQLQQEDQYSEDFQIQSPQSN